MQPTIIERLREDFEALNSILERASEPSLRVSAGDAFRKVLLLSAASHFERVLTESVLAFVERAAAGNELLVEFVRNKGLARQYHTLFEWNGANANSFFGLFGKGFRSRMEARVKCDSRLADSIRAFLEIGRDRNRLIHEDLGTFTLEKTAQEIFETYQRAALFLDELPSLLAGSSSSGQSAPR